MVVADCHVHTTNSDGALTLAELPAAARDGDVDLVAVTDHDRYHPDLDAPVTVRDGITVVHGIELRVDAGGQRVDLLGYGLDPTPELRSLVDALQRNRKERARGIVECVENRLDVTLAIDIEAGIGRPHIADAIAASPAAYDHQAAFDDLIGDGEPCYEPRDIPTFDEGRAVLADACEVVGLAHPLRYEDPVGALALAGDLDAVERYYPYDRETDPEPVDQAVRDHDLRVTGGSDAHDDRLGRAGLSGSEATAFRAAVGA
jgi:predicted metal-dependent phosphoesterase TrpH